jgi:hypothetical protein
MRKTVTVLSLLEKMNNVLSLPSISQEKKEAISFVLESALFEAGAYWGFSYLPSAGLTGAGTAEVKVEKEYDRRYNAHPNLAS